MSDQLNKRKQLLYGLWRDESFAVLDPDWTTRALDEINQWQAVSTVAEAIALARRLAAGGSQALACPLGDLDEWMEENEVDGSTEFSLSDLGTVGDGDWPGMPGQWTYQFLPESWPIGEDVETIFNGPYLLITPDQEDELLRLAATTGYELVRDDDAVNELGMWP